MSQRFFVTIATGLAMIACVTVSRAGAQQTPQALIAGLTNPESVVLNPQGQMFVSVIGERERDGGYTAKVGDAVAKSFGAPVARMKGEQLESIRFRHPLYMRDSIAVLGDYVTLDAGTGAVHTAPGHGSDSGLAWAEGSLWVGQYRDRKIHQIDPATGAILRTIESNRFVTGVTWVDGELWHGTWEGDESDIRRIHPESGAVLERLEMPSGTSVSGMESDGADLFYCGGGSTGKVRAVRRPKGDK